MRLYGIVLSTGIVSLLLLAGCDMSDVRDGFADGLAAGEGERADSPRVVEEVIEEQLSSEYTGLRVTRVVEGLEQPWAVAFLPDDRMLVSERPGRIQLVENGTVTEVQGAPEVHAQNQGGLLDIVPHPEWEDNGWIYMTYSRGDEEASVPALIRARLEGTELVDVEDLFESNSYTSPGRHYGSRILFLDDGTLLVTIGDRGAEPERAQDTQDHSGTVVRLNDDGTVPADNPFVGDDAYAPEIYSYGHRNIQGIVQRPDTGEIWATEHGPRGGDELNLIEPGVNYGWPTVSLGRQYPTQDPWGEYRSREGMEDPVLEFIPTLAPSGLAVVNGGAWDEQWQGNLLAGGLRAEKVMRLVVEDGEVLHGEELLVGTVGRIRDVRVGPDHALYITTGESEGGVYRVEPVD